MPKKIPDEKTNVFRINTSYNLEKQKISVKLNPDKEPLGPAELQGFLNTLLIGFQSGLHKILKDVPVMRPMTELELENKVYVFVNEEDNELYKVRKELFKNISSILNDGLIQIFPDVDYISSTLQHQQELAMTMEPEDAKQHVLDIEAVAVQVRKQVGLPIEEEEVQIVTPRVIN